MPDPAVGSATKMPHDDVTSATRSAPGVATRRDSGLTALILGFFAAAWLNWTPEASGALPDALQIGRAVAFIVSVLGGVRAIRSWRSGGVLNAPPAAHRYGLLVGVAGVHRDLGRRAAHQLRHPRHHRRRAAGRHRARRTHGTKPEIARPCRLLSGVCGREVEAVRELQARLACDQTPLLGKRKR